MSEETFKASKLDWGSRQVGEHARYLSLYKRLLGIRNAEIAPRLSGIEGNAGSYELVSPKAFKVQWRLADGSLLSLIANLSNDSLENVEVWSEDHLWLEGFATGTTLEAWSVVFRLRKSQ